MPQNFAIRTGETAFLCLQHFIRLLQNCNLHTVLDCPGGTFQGAGVNTVSRCPLGRMSRFFSPGSRGV